MPGGSQQWSQEFADEYVIYGDLMPATFSRAQELAFVQGCGGSGSGGHILDCELRRLLFPQLQTRHTGYGKEMLIQGEKGDLVT